MTNILGDAAESEDADAAAATQDGCGQRYERATSVSGESFVPSLACPHRRYNPRLSLCLRSQSGMQLMAEVSAERQSENRYEECVCVCVTKIERAK